jgi:hypothetical protein
MSENPLADLDFVPQCSITNLQTNKRCTNPATYTCRLPHVAVHGAVSHVLICGSCLSEAHKQKFPSRCPTCPQIFNTFDEYLTDVKEF